jgi:hypothetical protein
MSEVLRTRIVISDVRILGGSHLSRTKAWQIAFVSGVCGCIIAAVLVIGYSFVTTLIAVATLLIAIINALLNPDNSKGKGKEWLFGLLKHGMTVGGFLKAATVVVWLGALALTSYGAYDWYRLANIITLEGAVLSADGLPVDNATITLSGPGVEKNERVSQGKFSFKNLDLRPLPKKEMRLRVRSKDAENELDLNLSAGAPKDLVIKLPPGAPPFRISYFLIGGHAIDFLVRGEIDEHWEKRLAGKPFIIPNLVFEKLKFLIRNFSFPLDADYLGQLDKIKFWNDKGELDTRKEEDRVIKLAENNKGKLFFVGSWDTAFTYPIKTSLSEQDFGSLLRQKDKLHVKFPNFYQKDDLSIQTRLYPDFWKFVDHNDIKKFIPNKEDRYQRQERTLVNFLLHVTRDFIPSEFCLMYVMDRTCGDEPDWVAVLLPRWLHLRVALVENIKSHPISIQKFVVRENPQERLRNPVEDQLARSQHPPVAADTFALQMLKPGEKLLIPLQLVFPENKTWYDSNFMGEPLTKKQLYGLGAELGELAQFQVVYSKHPFRAFNINPNDLYEIIFRSQQRIEPEYVYGPSVAIESLTVDNVTYPFRQYDPTKLVLFAGSDMGSCPYVYTYSLEEKAWVSEGHILFAKKGKAKKGVDVKRLARFDGRILMKEMEREMTFIDSLQLKVLADDGRETILYPQLDLLRSQDNKYLTLHHGEQLEIHFRLPPEFILNSASQKYFLFAEGYYLLENQ